ncbi:hypothetical protein B0H14DRAFT_2655897 [Mycena olivaceomarginata]|nr:hypothetical protein B0H14DRAFT_2655897 [Mycena olivaceomarginata]
MNPAVLRLVGEKECHSDDEELVDGSGYMVHDKPGRDAPVTCLRCRRTRKWGYPPSDVSHTLLTNVPIDYFSPTFFNTLSVRQRASYMNNGVALPTEEHCRTWADIEKWRCLSPKDFMAQYGDTKCRLYKLPTEEELAMIDADDDEMEDEDDEDV